MTNLEAIISDYFTSERPALDVAYVWDIPKNCPFDFQRGSDSRAQANKRLRRVLSKIWKDEAVHRLEIATWYVRDWGGIKSNRKATIEKYISLTEADLAALPMQGVATWSKILAVRNPNAYAIFDARVSAALNALQLAKGVAAPILFPRLPSRNTKIAKFQKWLQIRSFSGHRPTYRDYVSLLTAVSQKSGAALEEVEMVLFANAENLVGDLMPIEGQRSSAAEPPGLFESFLSRHPISDEMRRALAREIVFLTEAFRNRFKDRLDAERRDNAIRNKRFD